MRCPKCERSIKNRKGINFIEQNKKCYQCHYDVPVGNMGGRFARDRY